jgi:hypothetical protein
MPAPTAFISYSHDSPEHKAWVLALASALRENGVDVSLDQWDLSPGQDIVAFMQKHIRDSERVILICSAQYVRKADAGVGGVGYERLVVTGELVANIDTDKFIPVVRNNGSDQKIPFFLGARLYVDFSNDLEYPAKREELLRTILGAPASPKPPLGSNPFSGSLAVPSVSPRAVGPTGVTASGKALLDDDWFRTQEKIATKNVDARGQMELRFGLHDSMSKSQIDLLAAVRASEIRTFGWPIGVVLEHRDEFRPKPYEHGIRAEIDLRRDSLSGGRSFDYWTLRSNGDFYLLKTLFEDQRANEKIFFNTRIIRVAEALLFADNLYTNLGAPSGTRLSIRVTHRGLTGRELTASNPNRLVTPVKTTAQESTNQIVLDLGAIRANLVTDVRRIIAPVFMLFDYTEFASEVYQDIVSRFARGEAS